MVQMKTSTAVLLAAAAVAPVLAQDFYAEDGLVARENYEDFNDLFAREFGFEDDLVAREYTDLEARHHHHTSSEDATPDDLQSREYEELDARFFSALFHPTRWFNHGQSSQASQDGTMARREDADTDLQAREYEELNARFLDNTIARVRRNFGSGQGQDGMYTREDADLETRRRRHHGHNGQAPQDGGDSTSDDSGAPLSREYVDYMETREVQPEYEELLARYFDDLYERELASEGEYSDLAARSPNLWDYMRHPFSSDARNKARMVRAEKKMVSEKANLAMNQAKADKYSGKLAQSASGDGFGVQSREMVGFYDLD